MLFVVAMEALNSLIQRADGPRTLTPLSRQAINHCASLYADNLVVLVASLQEDLNCLHQILLLFVGASGLVTNVDKCIATPIRCTEDMISTVQ
jgi:hypothetical protein